MWIDFNGHKLYSCDITVDGAYLEVFGKTKEEYDREMEEFRRELEERQKKAQEKAESRIPEWVEKGKALIYPERYDEWKKCVEIRASDLYHGMELDASLEIMESLENGVDIAEVKKIFDNQGHSGMSESLVRNIIFNFSKKGPEFWEATAYGEISEENKKAIADKKRENEELKEKNKQHEQPVQQEMAMNDKIVDWIRRGQNIIYPERYEKWSECVIKRSEDLYKGYDIECALELMEALENGTAMEDVKKIFDNQGHSGMSASIVRSILFTFSKQGPEFYEATVYGEIPYNDKKVLEEKKQENAELEKNNKKQTGKTN